MLINEAAKKCNITKKAIQYYVEQDLVNPQIQENGYRDFSEQDVKRLKQIVLYRKIGLTISEIKKILQNPTEITAILYQRTLELEKEKVKQSLLKRLESGENIENLEGEINNIGVNTIIIKRLLDLFPSYYGKFISLNFSRYLTGRIETDEQKRAFATIIEFFDNAPDMDLSPELQECLDEYLEIYSGEEGTRMINDILQKKEEVMKNIDEFVETNQKILEEYNQFRQTEIFKNSPANKLMEYMKVFCTASGYYEMFIPAMRKLSPLYNEYYEQMQKANEQFILKYPEYISQ